MLIYFSRRFFSLPSLSLFLDFFFRVSRFGFFSLSLFFIRTVVLVASFGRHDHDVNRWDKYDKNERRVHHR